MDARHPSLHAGRAVDCSDVPRADDPHHHRGAAREGEPKSCRYRHHEDGPRHRPTEGCENAQNYYSPEGRVIGRAPRRGAEREDGLIRCLVAQREDAANQAATSDLHPCPIRHDPHTGCRDGSARRRVPTPVTLRNDATCPSGCTPHRPQHCHEPRWGERRASHIGRRLHPCARALGRLRPMGGRDVHRRPNCALRSYPLDCSDPMRRNWDDGHSA